MEIEKHRLLLTVLAGMLMSTSGTAVDLSDVSRPNPIIYGYFRQQLIDSLVTRDFFGRPIDFVDPVVLDRQAYGLTTDFERRVYTKLWKMRAESDDVEKISGSALHAFSHPSQGHELLVQLSGLFKRISDEAGELSSMLRPLAGEANAEIRVKPEISRPGADSSFDSEMQLVNNEITQAAERVTRFLQGKDLTISVTQLRGEDMLTLLRRVHLQARMISRRMMASAIQPEPESISRLAHP